MPKDLRSFIQEVLEKRPGEFKRIDQKVDPRFGATAIADRFGRDNYYPALYFTRIGNSRIPLVLNLTATYDRLALALGSEPAEVVRNYGSRLAQGVAPRTVSRESAPVKEVVWRGADVDLTRLPLLIHNGLDGGPYITAGVGVMRDPESGRINAGLYRHQVFGKNELGVWFIDGHHGAYIYKRYETQNEPAPIVIVVGHHPAFVMGAITRLPGMGMEYEAAGSLLGEPLEVVQAETSDLPVPARAEIVIEGVVLPHQRREEGPFGEWPGHYMAEGPKPVIRVDAVTLRHDAIYHDIFSANREHLTMGSLPRMGSIYKAVRDAVPGVQAVNVPAHSRMHCYISLKKQRDAEVKKAAFAALNTEPENLKMIVVVDDDINVFNDGEVMWAIGTRFDASRDLLVVPGWSGPGGLLPVGWDFHPDGSKTARMITATIMDATKPSPPVPYPERAVVPREYVDAVDLGSIREMTELPSEVKV